MKKGESITFDYTGNIQTWTVPGTAIYKLEVWGGEGGGKNGQGGYSVGYKQLSGGTVLYIAVGGKGGDGSPFVIGSGYNPGGFNGGGSGKNGIYDPEQFDTYQFGGGGGGATHIATVTGTLSDIGYQDFVVNGKGFIVAGGGGGGTTVYSGSSPSYGGGTGGGTNGGANQGGTASGGGQTGGGSGVFGIGSNGSTDMRGGGGGGLFGGASGTASGSRSSGGGGSGYIGGVPSFVKSGITYSPSTTNGLRTGNGQAIITKVTGANVYYGDISCEVYLGETQIDSIYLGEKDVG